MQIICPVSLRRDYSDEENHLMEFEGEDQLVQGLPRMHEALGSWHHIMGPSNTHL